MLEVMPKLWIVHRNPQQRATLARLSGLDESEFIEGAPHDPDFASSTETRDGEAPAAVILGLHGDFELELDFVHRHRAHLADTRWLLLTTAADAEEAARLFRAVGPEILDSPPSDRTLRAFIAAAASRRDAASLAERQYRQRISERFSLWLGGVEVPGLLRALDPSLAHLPLLVRGVPGSGRSLLCHYVEIFRAARGPTLRLQGPELGTREELVRRISMAGAETVGGLRSVWIDEIGSLPATEQRSLAELISHGGLSLGSVETDMSKLRWIATAGPTGLGNELEPRIEQAFAPLQVEVPSLLDHPETLAAFALEVSRDWTRSVGGVAREFADSALLTLETHPWTGDRAELEAVLRTSLAASSREVLEDVDLRFSFPSDDIQADREPAGTTSTIPIPGPSQFPSPIRSPVPPQSVEVPIEKFGASDGSEGSRALDAIGALIEVEAEEEGGTVDLAGDLDIAVFEDSQSSRGPAQSETSADESTSLADSSFDLSRSAVTTSRAPDAEGGLGWRRLARSLSHEIRNPLVSIRTFAELLPEHFEDETFRTRFTELVGRDVAHISNVLARLSNIAEREKFEAEPVDVSALIEELLEERRERIARGRLLVLRELERDAPLAWADARGLQIVLAGLLDRALESLPERGDLFVATRHLDRGADGRAKLRILLRHHNPTASNQAAAALPELDPQSNILEYVLAETVVASSGGTLTIDATDAQETLILVDLQTPI